MADPIVLIRETSFPSREVAVTSGLHSVNVGARGFKSPVCYARTNDLAKFEESARREREGIPTVITLTITETNFPLIQRYITQQYVASGPRDYGYDPDIPTFSTLRRNEVPYRPVYGIAPNIPNDVLDALEAKVGFLNPVTDKFEYFSYRDLRANVEGQRQSPEDYRHGSER